MSYLERSKSEMISSHCCSQSAEGRNNKNCHRRANESGSCLVYWDMQRPLKTRCAHHILRFSKFVFKNSFLTFAVTIFPELFAISVQLCDNLWKSYSNGFLYNDTYKYISSMEQVSMFATQCSINKCYLEPSFFLTLSFFQQFLDTTIPYFPADDGPCLANIVSLTSSEYCCDRFNKVIEKENKKNYLCAMNIPGCTHQKFPLP